MSNWMDELIQDEKKFFKNFLQPTKQALPENSVANCGWYGLGVVGPSYVSIYPSQLDSSNLRLIGLSTEE